MATILEKAIEQTLKNEGGFVHDPDDPGGATNYGITQQTLSAFYGRDATIEEVKAITQDLAKTIYVALYFGKPRLAELPECLCSVMIDMSIHHGPGRAVKLLQQVLLQDGFDPGPVDGIIGPRTVTASMDAIAKSDCAKLVNNLVDKRVTFFLEITARNPALQKFLKGWVARAKKYYLSP